MQTETLKEIKKTIIFFGTKSHLGKIELSLSGTGFLMNVDNMFMIATAKHVVFLRDNQGNYIFDDKGNYILNNSLHIFNNSKKIGNTIRVSSIQELYAKGGRCFVHKDNAVDLAILTFHVSVEDDIKTFSRDMFMRLNEMNELEDVFFMSFQPGISNLEKDNKVHPIIRKGIISRMNSDKTFFIDGAAFPGNSGSPVFIYPKVLDVDDTGNIKMGGNKNNYKFAGIVSDYIPYTDAAISQQTGRARVLFEENTGLSRVMSVDLLEEILQQSDFKNYYDELLKLKK